MEDNTLFDVYVDELKDLWSANDQMRDAVRQMAEGAADRRLATLLEGLATRLEAHNRTIHTLLTRHSDEEEPDRSRAMTGLTAQAREEALDKPLTEAARDVVIVAQVQRMSHYGIAGYGTARALAEALELTADAAALSADLTDVYATDELLTHLAENVINPTSADEDAEDDEEDEDRELNDVTGEEKNGYEDEFDEDEEDEDQGRLK